MIRFEIQGRLTDAPTLQTLDCGRQIAIMTVAADDPHYDRAGDWHQRAIPVPVQVWDYRARGFAETLRKGDRVFFSGRVEPTPAVEGETASCTPALIVSETWHFWQFKERGETTANRPGGGRP